MTEVLEKKVPAKSGNHAAEVLATSFKELAQSASYLNSISDSLGKNIGLIDSKLKRLKIGVTAWIEFQEFANDEDDKVRSWCEIGFTKLPKSDTWGIAIRSVSQGVQDDFLKEEEIGPFNEWPRDTRLKSISKIPELITTLNREVTKRAAEVRPVMEQVEEFARVLQFAIDRNEENIGDTE